MNINLVLFHGWTSGASALWPVLLDVVVKGMVLLLVAGLLVLALYRASAALRQMVWLLALAALLVMPLVSAALPSWRVLPSWAQLELVAPQPSQPLGVAEKSGDSSQRMNAKDPGAPVVLLEHRLPTQFTKDDTGPRSEVPLAKAPQPSVAATAAARSVTPLAAASPMPSRWMRVMPWLMLVWAVGIVSCLVPLVLGRLSLWHLARRSRRLEDSSWTTLTERAAKAIDLRHPVTLLQSDAEPMPMVWGLWQSRLLLPAEAEAWPQDRRWVVLLHELAHAKRRDCLAKLIAQIACAVYWFNPLCWTAFKLMQREAEVACDDLVLAAGHRPSDYAQHLLEIASGLNSGMLASYSSIGMARKSKVEGRLLAILDPRRNRSALTRLTMLAVVILIAGVVLPLSLMKAAAAENPLSATQPVTNPPSRVVATDAWTPAPASVQPSAQPGVFVYRAQVVDGDGRPLADVKVEMRAVKGQEEDKWEGQTDSAGRFNWSNTVSEKLVLGLSKDGYRGVGSREVTAGADEQKIKLLKLLTIKGSVVDAVTKKPLASFTAMEASSYYGPDQKMLDRYHAKTFSGQYSLQFEWMYPMNWVYVEAPGHRSALSRAVIDEEGTITVDLVLEPAKDLTGLVLGPDGKPAAGAQVYVGDTQHGMWLQSPWRQKTDPREPPPGAARVKAGLDGRFTVPPAEGHLALALVHADGFAVVSAADLEKSEKVTLKKWGQVEGTLSRALAAGGPQTIVLTSIGDGETGPGLVTFATRRVTDADGGFVLDHVPPGLVMVARAVPLEKDWTRIEYYDHGTVVGVGEGQTVTVPLGGQGRSVKATVGALPGVDLAKVFAYAELRPASALQGPTLPPGFARMTVQERKGWIVSPEGRAALLEQQRQNRIMYATMLAADGTFLIPDVPAGKYVLKVMVQEANLGPAWGEGKIVGTLKQDVEVPAATKEDVDLGRLQLGPPPPRRAATQAAAGRAASRPAVGNPATPGAPPR